MLSEFVFRFAYSSNSQNSYFTKNWINFRVNKHTTRKSDKAFKSFVEMQGELEKIYLWKSFKYRSLPRIHSGQIWERYLRHIFASKTVISNMKFPLLKTHTTSICERSFRCGRMSGLRSQKIFQTNPIFYRQSELKYTFHQRDTLKFVHIL